MAAYFLCLTAGGGIPLYCKRRKDIDHLPFPVAGSLNGVHIFAVTQGAKLQSTTTGDARVTWKTYKESLTLILVTGDGGTSPAHSERLLDYLFHSMVLLYGADNLASIRNLERFKREIKVCNQIIDYILDLIEYPSVCEMTNCVEVAAGPECPVLQHYIDTFCEAASSGYGCVYVNGRIAVATSKWWQLAPCELVLLHMLQLSLPQCTSRDLPVFLPITSPQVPHRLLTFSLIRDVEVCVVCGPVPSLVRLEQEVDRFWRSSIDTLKNLKQNHCRVLPQDVTIDQNILSVLVLNTETHRFLCCTNPHCSSSHTNSHHTSTQHREQRQSRLQTLRAFYLSVSGRLWPSARMTDIGDVTEGSPGTELSDRGTHVQIEDHERMLHRVKQTYIVADTHKCFALQEGARQIYIVTNMKAPTYALRAITKNTLDEILKGKGVLL